MALPPFDGVGWEKHVEMAFHDRAVAALRILQAFAAILGPTIYSFCAKSQQTLNPEP